MTKASQEPARRALQAREIAETRKRLEAMTFLDRTAALLEVAGSAVRLKLLYLLEHERDLPVAELADRVGVSLSAVSQHLAKLRIYGLVAARREAQSLRYSLTDHPFVQAIRAEFL